MYQLQTKSKSILVTVALCLIGILGLVVIVHGQTEEETDCKWQVQPNGESRNYDLSALYWNECTGEIYHIHTYGELESGDVNGITFESRDALQDVSATRINL